MGGFKVMSILTLGGSVGGFAYHSLCNTEAPYQIWFMLVVGLVCLVLHRQEQ